MASKYVADTKAGKSISAYVVLNKKGQFVAKVSAHFSDSGKCLVNVFDAEAGFQHASAGGGGYDKFTAALSHMTIGGHAMSDHCGKDGVPKMPKGRKTYPKDFKVKPGFTLANWVSVSKATGERMDGYRFRDRAIEKLGEDAEFDAIRKEALKLEREWQDSDDYEAGYSSCFRLPGLDYLKAIGFNVFQAV